MQIQFDAETMPNCSCPSWSELFYPCKHFFCVFEKHPLWNWESLSPLYRNSPFLTLDYEKEVIKQHDADVNDVMNTEPLESDDNKVDDDLEKGINFNNIEPPSQKKPIVTPRDCRETLLTIKNLTYDIDDNSHVFEDVQNHLNLALNLLRNDTKKEKGITVRPKNNDDKYERKRKFLDIPKKKNIKVPKRFGAAGCKKKEAAKTNIQKEKESTKSNENVVLEEIVIDDIEIDGKTSFTTTIPVLQVFDFDDSADETPSPRCLLQYGDLKLINNKRMLNDNVINAVQKMLHTQYPDIDGLHDTSYTGTNIKL